MTRTSLTPLGSPLSYLLAHRIMVTLPEPGRSRNLVGNNHFGIPAYNGTALPLVSELRELLKSGRSANLSKDGQPTAKLESRLTDD